VDAPKVKITVEILRSEYDDLQEMAKRQGIPANDVVRQAIITLKSLLDEAEQTPSKSGRGYEVSIKR
jgi:uncharacterized protein (DUF111 family)